MKIIYLTSETNNLFIVLESNEFHPVMDAHRKQISNKHTLQNKTDKCGTIQQTVNCRNFSVITYLKSAYNRLHADIEPGL